MSKFGGSAAAARPHQLEQQRRRRGWCWLPPAARCGARPPRAPASSRRKSGGADQQRLARREAGGEVRAGRRRHARSRWRRRRPRAPRVRSAVTGRLSGVAPASSPASRPSAALPGDSDHRADGAPGKSTGRTHQRLAHAAGGADEHHARHGTEADCAADAHALPEKKRFTPSRKPFWRGACLPGCALQGLLELAHQLALLGGQVHRRLDDHAAEQVAARDRRAPASRPCHAGERHARTAIPPESSAAHRHRASAPRRVPPSAAVAKLTGTSQERCSPSRSKIACSRTWISTYRSPGGPPLRPASPSPERRMRSPLSTPAGTFTAACARGARVPGQGSCRRDCARCVPAAPAARAGLLQLKEALRDAHLARAAAGVAGDGLAALGRAAAVAGLALGELGDLDLHRVAEHGLIELQLELVAQVGAAKHLRAAAAARTAEDVAEHVAEDVAERIARRSRRAPPPRAAASRPGMAMLVVDARFCASASTS